MPNHKTPINVIPKYIQTGRVVEKGSLSRGNKRLSGHRTKDNFYSNNIATLALKEDPIIITPKTSATPMTLGTLNVTRSRYVNFYHKLYR